MTQQLFDGLGPTPMSSDLLETLARANAYARAQSHKTVTLEHVLLALSEDPDAVQLLRTTHVDIDALKADVSGHISRNEDRYGDGPPPRLDISPEVGEIMKAASAAASGRRPEINGAIVLAAIVGDGRSTAAHTLKVQGLTFEHAISFLRGEPVPPAVGADAEAVAKPSTKMSADEILAGARSRVQSHAETTAGRGAKLGSSAVRPSPETAPPPPKPETTAEEKLRAPEPLTTSGPAQAKRTPADQTASAPSAPSGQPQEQTVPSAPVAAPSPSPVQSSTPGPAEVSAPAPGPAPGLPPQAQPQQPAQPPLEQAPKTDLPPLKDVFAQTVQNSPAPPLPTGGQQQRPAAAPSAQPPPPQQPAGGAPFNQRPPAAAQPQRRGPATNAPGPGVGGPLATNPAGHNAPPLQPGAPGAQPPMPGPTSLPPQVRPGTAGAPVPEVARAPQAPQPSAAPPQSPQTPSRRGTQPQIVEAGQLVENIPRKMKVGVAMLVEARIAKGGVRVVTQNFSPGGAPQRHEILVTKAMSVRLRAPANGFTIETSSPETQWIENNLGALGDDYASWRWTITPKTAGKKQLQLIVSARTVGADGLAAETVLPDQVINVKVRANYAKAAKRWSGWIAAAIVGGLFARFGETFFELGSMLLKTFSAGLN